MKDYYKILELESDASPEQILSQQRFLLHAWHPDKFPNDELKAKAEEKTKEINEAYSVLGDPAKREAYDRALRSSASAPSGPKQQYSQTSKSNSHTRSGYYCQSCGLPAETKYVEFYENIGMIFIRQHRSIKGNLCKPCIDYYFWNLTGRTMLLGWWGIKSFIVTPFILLNNLFRFFFTTGLRKPKLRIAPSPSAFWVFTTIGGFLLICFYLFSMVSPVSAQPTYAYSSTTDYSPTAFSPLSSPVPTKIKPTATPESNCISWSQVTTNMIGLEKCVYGTVYKTRFVGESTFQILFSADPEMFFLAGGSYYYNVSNGQCVVADGEILRSGVGVPYINIDKALYKCESWMK